MKIRVSVIAVCLAAALFSGCASKAAEKPEKISETAAAETTAAPEESLPEESFEKLPEGAEGELTAVSAAAHSAFPDAKGKKMFGFKGTEQIQLEGETADCYVFDYYTYKSKTYNKVATLAKSVDGEGVYMLDDTTGEYHAYTVSDDQAAAEK